MTTIPPRAIVCLLHLRGVELVARVWIAHSRAAAVGKVVRARLQKQPIAAAAFLHNDAVFIEERLPINVLIPFLGTSLENVVKSLPSSAEINNLSLYFP